MTTTKEPEPEKDPYEPGGRKHQTIGKMTSEALAAAYGDAVKFRANGLSSLTDDVLARWLQDARDELRKRGHLDLVKDHLAVYYDPSRTPPVFGPGAPTATQGAIDKTEPPRALKSAG
jgi:hypothetical protein